MFFVRLSLFTSVEIPESVFDGLKINLESDGRACSSYRLLTETVSLAEVVDVIIKICALRARIGWSPNPGTTILDTKTKENIIHSWLL